MQYENIDGKFEHGHFMICFQHIFNVIVPEHVIITTLMGLFTCFSYNGGVGYAPAAYLTRYGNAQTVGVIDMREPARAESTGEPLKLVQRR